MPVSLITRLGLSVVSASVGRRALSTSPTLSTGVEGWKVALGAFSPGRLPSNLGVTAVFRPVSVPRGILD